MKAQISSRRYHKYLLGGIVLIFGLVITAPVYAGEAININLRIEEPSQTVLNINLDLPYSCEVTDSTGATSTHSGYKAICALQTAQEAGLLNFTVSDFGWGLFVDNINNIGGGDSMFWGLYQNNNSSTVGATDLILSEGDNMLMAYIDWNYSNEILNVSTPNNIIAENIATLQAQQWNGSEFENLNSAVNFFINQNIFASTSGTLEYTPEFEGALEIYVEGEGKVRSERSQIQVEAAPEPEIILPTTTVRLRLETYDATLYNNDFVVTACPSSEAGDEYTLNAWCAVEQLAENLGWTISASWGEFGIYLSQINQYDGSDFNWWSWYSELDMGITSLNSHILAENENLLLAYGINPMKTSVDNYTPQVGETITLNNLDQDFTAWPPTWTVNTPSSTFVINDEEIFDVDGIFELEITTTTAYEVYGKKAGYLDSNTIIIEPTYSTSTPPAEEDNSNEDSGNQNNLGGGGGYTPPPAPETISDQTIQEAVDKILAYLESQQAEDGKILDGGITDWSILSFGANNQYAEDIASVSSTLLEYAESYNFTDSSDLNLCAAYPRHILALLATGTATDDANITSLTSKIQTECISENLYGLNGINDDIFALISMLALDYTLDDAVVSTTYHTILDDQTDSGAFTWDGWAGADITGAAINTLTYAQEKNLNVEQSILNNAKQYLKDNQLDDGGWTGSGITSDVLTTSWALMGINALGETQDDWFTGDNKNPWHVLINNLNNNGYYESAWSPGAVDWFATKHAVPALLGKSWPIILNPKQPENPTNPSSPSGSTYTPPANEITTSTPTSTLDVDLETETPTSTPTSTPELISEDTTTSTEDILGEVGGIQIFAPEENSSADAQDKEETEMATPAPTYYNYPEPTEEGEEEIVTEGTTTSTSDQLDTRETLSTYTSPTPMQKAARGVFGSAVALAGGLGLYLVWRLLRSLV